MAYRDYPDYERDRLYDDRDAYSVAAHDRGPKRPRSPPSPEHRRAAGTEGALYSADDGASSSRDAKRLRTREDYDRADYGPAGGASTAAPVPAGAASAYSPPRGSAHGARRTWAELDPDEKEREWLRYERELEWERYHAADREADGYRAEYDDRYARYDYDRTREPDHWAGQVKQAQLTDPMDSPTILPFRRYAQLLRSLGSEPSALASGPEATQQLYNKYQEYRVAFNRRVMHQFWEAHKDEKWFKEKYGIEEEHVEARMHRRRAGRQGRKEAWLDELRSGALDRLTWDAHALSSEQEGSTSANGAATGALRVTTRLGEEETLETQEVVEIAPETDQILIRHLPTEVGRDDLEAVLQAHEGFRYLALGEPHPAKRLCRMGWAIFATADRSILDSVVEALNQTVIHGQKLVAEVPMRPAQAKLKVAPGYAGTLPRLARDYLQVQALLHLLEEEDKKLRPTDKDEEEAQSDATTAAIESHCRLQGLDLGPAEERGWLDELAVADKSATIVSESSASIADARCRALKKILDLHIDLLRQAYHCDYYSSTLCDYPEELRRRSPRVVRRVEGDVMREPNNGERLWATNVDTKHKLLMRPNDADIEALGGKSLEKHLLELAAPFSQQDEAEKHRCIVQVNGQECGKPFKAQIFVQKHVLNKHRDWFDKLTEGEQFATRYFNNYVRDPQRVMPLLTAERAANSREAGNGFAAGPGASLSARLGGYEHNGSGAYGNYGAGSLLRMGSAYSNGRDQQASFSGASDSTAARRFEPLPSAPKPLDPRASGGPRSYQDLDAGGPAETAELELEY